MIDREYEEQTVVVEEKNIVAMKCDICNKPIVLNSFYFQGSFQGTEESSKNNSYAEKGEFEVCSEECLTKRMEDLEYYFENFASFHPMIEIQYTQYV